MGYYQRVTVPKLDIYNELRGLDAEFKDILHYLSTQTKLEPQDIIDNTERLVELARIRAALVTVAMFYKQPVVED